MLKFDKHERDELNKLQQQKRDLDNQLSLEQAQADIIKDYAMKQGNYKIIITVYELNDLQPKSLKLLTFQLDQKTACDAFVQIKVGNQTKITAIKKQTNNPIFNEQFYFQFPKMSVQQLDRQKIQFNVFDTKFWGKTQSLIGSFELDWTNVYFKRNHEIYRAWLTLYDPNNQLEGPVGYLLANIAVLGEEDQITIHDSAFIKDPLVTIQDTITSPKLKLLDCSIAIQIYRAQNLIPLNFNSQINAYVIAKFSSNKIKSSRVVNLNPEWNQCLKIGTQVPNKSKYITLQVRNRNLLSADDIIGVIKIPFVDIFDEEQSKPQWGHLYGPPMAGKDIQPFNCATKMQVYGDKIGSHYRGRLLYKVIGRKDVCTKNIKNKLVFKFPYRVIPIIPQKLFTLRIDLIEGFGLPKINQCYIQICMGEYTIKSKDFKVTDGFCEFYQSFDDKNINLPQNLESMPDLVIYYCNGLNQENRIAFLRIKASQIFNNNINYDEVKVKQLTIDRTLHVKQKKTNGGFIACKIHLFTSNSSSPPQRRNDIFKLMKKKREFQLKIFLYRGQNLPPANIEGDCDPMVKFSFNQLSLTSEHIKSTYNPVWNQILSVPVTTQDLFRTNMEKCLVCDVYDHQDSLNHNYIGSFSVRINGLMKKKLKVPLQNKKQSIQFIYSKPKWYPVVNPNVQIGNDVFGRVLVSCCLFEKKYTLSDLSTLKLSQLDKTLFNKIRTQTFKKNINFFLIGIRDLKLNADEGFIKSIARKMIKQVRVTPSIKMNCAPKQKQQDFSKNISQHKNTKNEIQKSQKISQYGNSKTKSSSVKQQTQTHFDEQFILKSNGCQINKIYPFADVQIPKNKLLSTFIDFKIILKEDKKQSIFGYNSVDLKQLKNVFLDDTQQKKENLDKNQILDVDDLQIKLKKLTALNKIDKKNKIEEENADFISPKRLNALKNQDFIIPTQIQHNYDNNDENDPQIQIQMDKMLLQFERELQSTKGETGNFFSNLKNNFPNSSSNNNPQNLNKGKNYNHIDFQQTKLFESKIRKIQVGDRIPQQNQDMNDEEELLISEQESKILSKGFINFQNSKVQRKQIKMQNEDQNHQQDSSKNLVHQNTTKQVNLFSFMNTDNKSKLNSQKNINLISKTLTTINANKGQLRKGNHKSNRQKSQVSNFDLNESLSLSENEHNRKIINFEQVKRGLKQQQQHQKQAVERQEQYKYASAVKLSLFKWMRKQPEKQVQTYQDYDTDQQQNLDIIPEWYKNRKILGNDLENFLAESRTIHSVPIYRGRKMDDLQTRIKQKVGSVKMVVLSGQDKIQLQSTAQYYKKLLTKKQFACRIYVLKGKSLLTQNLQKPNTYLRFTYGQKVTQYKNKIVKAQNNPEYYMCHEEWISLPGPSTIKIQVMEAIYLVGSIGDNLAKDKLIGYTEIDVEDRYFIKKWHLFDKKPIQLRNLYSSYGIGTQGRLQTWVDLISKKHWLVNPVEPICPPPFEQFQLRVIVNSTKDCVFKNQQLQSNDIFVRGQIGGGNYQETDVHWACRSVGNFNYRFKFSVFYPPKPEDMYSDIFIVQVWDKDVIGYNNLIGQTRINLNKMHKIIQKAVARKKPIAASKKIIEKNMALTDKFWFDVYNHKQKDQFGQLQSQGKVQLSFQVVPITIAKTQRANGFGRSEPNVYPTLQEPSGRLNFNFLQPLDFLKQILGPNLYKSLCFKFFCFLVLAIVIFLLVFFSTSIIAGLVARG